MISYDGSDFTSASLSKKTSPVRQDLVQSTGKVVKSIFVPNVGWASQVCGGWTNICSKKKKKSFWFYKMIPYFLIL